jgi:hypothetical protein
MDMTRHTLHVHADVIELPAGTGIGRASDAWAHTVLTHVARTLRAAGSAASKVDAIACDPEQLEITTTTRGGAR